MGKSKVVSIEDRIPKLKQQRRKKANRRLIFLLLLFFLLIICIIYFQSPLSRVKTIEVKGNRLIQDEEIERLSGIKNDDNIWKVNKKNVEKKINAFSEVKDSEVSISLPNTIVIQVNEHKRLAYLAKGTSYIPIGESGKMLKESSTEEMPSDAPIIVGFKEGKVLNKMVAELGKLPKEVYNTISEIHSTPKKADAFHINAFMNDGFEVSASLDTFSEKMEHYPSIISQLDPKKKGIIDLEVGSYFKAYEGEGEKEK
ncbi:cell division protein FtsQ/DivIB [Niallia sp. NCCP-28]|uniref:cell division protein FtsQ/DivIB n=1 Tax=Niallia sp. NCCP-28 TaxID=2934712 RepID=UPI002080082A|nr:FtsQ-type POTRA domain-containing protein [Niallia sp. NCCP-28]GKU82383.1 cell division protein DivIB [Niallia sp. NCCP-28]